MATSSKFVKVRVEEIAIGALVGIGVGIAATSPLTMGLPSLNPIAAGIGAAGFAQAALLWTGASAGGAVGAWWAARQERDSHEDGHRYWANYSEAVKAMQPGQTAQFSSAQRAGKLHGINLGGLELARSQEVRHMPIIGTNGSGKTAVLDSIINQVQDRRERLLIHDPQGDYTRRLFGKGGTVLGGPWDARAHMLDIAADICTPALAHQFATALVGKVEGDNKSFYQGAAALIEGLIVARLDTHQPWSWRDLVDDMRGTPQEVAARAALAGDAVDVRKAIPSAFPPSKQLERADQSKISIATEATRWIRSYAVIDRPDTPRFSIRKWLLGTAHQDIHTLILNANGQYQDACESIFGAILSVLVALVNSAEMPSVSADVPGLWLILDEHPQVGMNAMEMLQKASALGRKKGVRSLLAMQDDSQAAAEVGAQKAGAMLAVQGMRCYTNLSPQMASTIANQVGQRRINRIETTSENGAMAGKTKHLVSEPAILVSDFTGLHPIIEGPNKGVELIVWIGDRLGRLLVPFIPKPDPETLVPALVESEAWKFGVMPSWQREHGIAKNQRPNDTKPETKPAVADNSADSGIDL